MAAIELMRAIRRDAAVIVRRKKYGFGPLSSLAAGFLAAMLLLMTSVPQAQAQRFCLGVRQVGFCIDNPTPQRPTQTQPRQQQRPNARPAPSGTQARSPSQSRPSQPQYSRQGIIDLQTILSHLGFNPGTIDGALGPATRRAYSAWQRTAGFNPDGAIRPAEIQVLVNQFQAATANVPSSANSGSSQLALITDFNLMAGTSAEVIEEAPPAPVQPPVPHSTAAFCSALSLAGGFAVPRRHCEITGTLALAAAQRPETISAEPVCGAYAAYVEGTIGDAQGSPADAFQNSLVSRFGTPEYRDAHGRNAEACIAGAIAAGDHSRVYFFAALMYGSGSGAAAELMATQHALGLGVEADLARASYWMRVAKAFHDAGHRLLAPASAGLETASLMTEIEDLRAAGSGYGAYSATSATAGNQAVPPPGIVEAAADDAAFLAAAYLDARNGEFIKTFGIYRDLLGDDLEADVEACSQLASRYTLSELAAMWREGQSVAAELPMVTTLKFCRSAAYVTGELHQMIIHDHLLNLRTGGGNAMDIASHYVLANGVAGDRALARSLLEHGLEKAGSDTYAVARMDTLLASLQQ